MVTPLQYAQRMPVWAAVVIGLGSGFGAGLLGTLLSISYQQHAEFRDRQVRSAEEFLRAAEAVRRQARKPQARPPDAILLLQSAWDNHVTPINLVELVYGCDSWAAGLARVVGNELADAVDTLQAPVQGHGDTADTVQRHMTEVTNAITEFSKTVHKQLRRRALGPTRSDISPQRGQQLGWHQRH